MVDTAYREIVDTFFGNKLTTPPKKVLKKKKSKKLKRLPLLGLLACVVLTAIVATGVYIKNRHAKTDFLPVKISYTENILHGGKLNYPLIKKISFGADAKHDSALLGLSVKLVNHGTSGRGVLAITFKEPMDFSQKYLLLTAKTAEDIGGLKVMLQDAVGHIYEIPHITFQPDWNSEYVELKKRENFDLREVKGLEVAVKRKNVENPTSSTIYIRDIILVSLTRPAGSDSARSWSQAR